MQADESEKVYPLTDIYYDGELEDDSHDDDDSSSFYEHNFFREKAHRSELPKNTLSPELGQCNLCDEPLEQIPPHILSNVLRHICRNSRFVQREIHHLIQQPTFQLDLQQFNEKQTLFKIQAIRDRIRILCQRIKDRLYIDCFQNNMEQWDAEFPTIAQDFLLLIQHWIEQPMADHRDDLLTTFTLLEAFTKQFRESYLDTDVQSNRADCIIDVENKVEDKLFTLWNKVLKLAGEKIAQQKKHLLKPVKKSLNDIPVCKWVELVVKLDKHGVLILEGEHKQMQLDFQIQRILKLTDSSIVPAFSVLMNYAGAERRQEMLHRVIDSFGNSFESKVLLLHGTKEYDWLIKEIQDKPCSGFMRKYALGQKSGLVKHNPQYIIQRANKELLREFTWILMRLMERLTRTDKLKKALTERNSPNFVQQFIKLLKEDLVQEAVEYPPSQDEMKRPEGNQSTKHGSSIDFQKDKKNRPSPEYTSGIDGLLVLAKQAFQNMGDGFFRLRQYEAFCKELAKNAKESALQHPNLKCSREDAVFLLEHVLSLAHLEDEEETLWRDVLELGYHICQETVQNYLT